jgi:hypothetical protein
MNAVKARKYNDSLMAVTLKLRVLAYLERRDWRFLSLFLSCPFLGTLWPRLVAWVRLSEDLVLVYVFFVGSERVAEATVPLLLWCSVPLCHCEVSGSVRVCVGRPRVLDMGVGDGMHISRLQIHDCGSHDCGSMTDVAYVFDLDSDSSYDFDST